MSVETRAEAMAIAERMLREQIQPRVPEEVVLTFAGEFPTCWLVGYQTRAFLETGAVSHALAGGGPIIINRLTGVGRIGTSALPDEEQLDLV